MLLATAASPAAELVYLDSQGVVRWSADHREVALFGANYCLPSSSDYRAAGYVHADRKKLVEKDMAHFARMGWDAMRLCLWGDWENCDRQGNLIVNDHLDVMDYAIARARERGVNILFTPITTYSAWWPDGKPGDDYPGFSRFFERGRLCLDPAAITASSNYVHQILLHVNPYTGVALKDEPNILFVEMINEPVHPSSDPAGVTAYINTLVGAVRSTGCQKILFHNVSQNFRIAPAIKASRAQGVTFAWYPTGLNHNHALTENHLRAVDDFPPMLRPELADLPKAVYEFDSADMNSGYMYPAMARTFREVGAQFVAMFSYDMLDTAPYNLGWQTHFLNLVYSPRKAMSAIIAAEATRALPRGARYGDYPQNRRFGPFRVSYEEDTSEMESLETFLYANDTQTRPRNPAALKRIAGLGSSPVVDYEGCGSYFLDKLASGVWRLELYPDAVIVQDPFAQRLNYQTVCSRLVVRQWPMTVRLPDLGDSFHIAGINTNNSFSTTARAGTFQAKPGVFLLAREEVKDLARLPQTVGQVGLREFICPEPLDLPLQILPRVQDSSATDEPISFTAEAVGSTTPRALKLHARLSGDADFRAVTMSAGRGFRFHAGVPAGTFAAGNLEYFFAADTAAGPVRFPAESNQFLALKLVAPASPVPLFSAETDLDRLVFTRIGDGVRRGILQRRKATETDPAALRLFLPLSQDRMLDDYTASVSVKERVLDRGSRLRAAKAVRVKMRGQGNRLQAYLTLVEADGTSWSKPLTLSADWTEQVVPLGDLQLAPGVKLPLGFPERWNYWLTPAKGRGGPGDGVHPEAVERLQISLRPTNQSSAAEADMWVDVASVSLLLE
jgi:hypothetical protein